MFFTTVYRYGSVPTAVPTLGNAPATSGSEEDRTPAPTESPGSAGLRPPAAASATRHSG